MEDLSAFAGLADHLLAPILAQACTANRGGPAAAQVRNVAQLTLVGRRFKALLEKEKPALSLDCSQAPLSAAQLAWLEQGVRNVHSVTFHSEEALFWEGPHLAFLKREGQTLTQLRGLPLRLVAASGLLAGPDLTRSPITVLGIQCDRPFGHMCARLVAAWLPAGLKRLELHVPYGCLPCWSNKPGYDAPGCLPHLHTIACTSSGIAECMAALGRAGAHVEITTPRSASVSFGHLKHMHVDDSNCNSRVCSFSGRSLHISTGALEIICGEVADMDDLLAVLFPAGLQEFRVEYTCTRDTYLFTWLLDVGFMEKKGAPVTAVVRRCMRDRGGAFAFEASNTILGWRVWPPIGTPAWEAAAALHDAALKWAVEGEEDIEKYFVAALPFQ